MKKRSSFDSVWPFVMAALVFLAFMGIWHVLAIYMWVWNPFGLAVNLNPNILATCEDFGLINCTAAPERTFQNYNTDPAGEFHVFGLAFVIMGGIVSILMWTRIKLNVSFMNPFRIYQITPAEAKDEDEPYVSDDPQQEVEQPQRQ